MKRFEFEYGIALDNLPRYARYFKGMGELGEAGSVETSLPRSEELQGAPLAGVVDLSDDEGEGEPRRGINRIRAQGEVIHWPPPPEEIGTRYQLGSVHQDPEDRELYIVTKVYMDENNVSCCDRLSLAEIEDPIINWWAAEKGANKSDPTIEV